MSDGTKIEWAANADGTPGATWNPIRARHRETGAVGWHCTHASTGCGGSKEGGGCYAEAINKRLGTGLPFIPQSTDKIEVFLDEAVLTKPLRWQKPRTIFVCSMTDLFGEFVSDHMIHRVLAVAALCPHHTFIVLTKRAGRMRAWLEQWKGREFIAAIFDDNLNRVVDFPLRNVWIGISAERQREANDRIPDLLLTPAAVRFASIEPLLGPIDLTGIGQRHQHGKDEWLDGLRGARQVGTPLRSNGAHVTDHSYGKLDWIIVGGESGPKARPLCKAWARRIRDQCAAAGVDFFFKQWGEFAPVRVDEPFHVLVREEDGAWGDLGRLRGAGLYPMRRVGKRKAGRMLDGRTHDDRPPLACEAAP